MEHETKDPQLWKTARKRATFRYHALIYFIMILFFWTLWYISLKNTVNPKPVQKDIPWPVWPMVAWGIGLFLHYMAAFKNRETLAEEEYQKLKNKQ